MCGEATKVYPSHSTQRRIFLNALSAASTISSTLPVSRATAAPQTNLPPMLRLSRAEISKKLSRIPVFFVESANGGIVVDINRLEGLLYLRKHDAEDAFNAASVFAKEAGSPLPRRVSFVFLNDVYYPLIRKSAKLEMFPRDSLVGGVVSDGNQDMTFRIVDSDLGPVSLFFIENIAFKGADPTQINSIQKPLFLSKQDCLRAWDDLRESQRKKGTKIAKGFVALTSNPSTSDSSEGEDEPLILTLNFNTMIQAMQRGDAALSGLPDTEDMRVLEFFPESAAIEEARETYAATKVDPI